MPVSSCLIVGSGDNFDFQKLHPIPCTLYSALKNISNTFLEMFFEPEQHVTGIGSIFKIKEKKPDPT